jgi:hypothetical protein
MQYQQTYRRGETTGQFQRDCLPRYDILAEFCEQYTRPFTVFDLGANYGYFGFRLADNFDCVSVMADTKPIGDLCKANRGRFIWLNHRMTAQDLIGLSRCEHFDVVLAYNVLHHFPDWKAAADALLHMGDHIIAEVPAPDDPGTLNAPITSDMFRYFEARADKVLGVMDSHVSGNPRTTFLLKGSPKIIDQTIDVAARRPPPVEVKVESNFDYKTIAIEHTGGSEDRPFIAGMNLWNAHELGIAYPANLAGLIKTAVYQMPSLHTDMRPWNFVLDGKVAHPIDWENKPWRKGTRDDELKLCLSLL